MAIQEYPRHVHKAGGAFLIVYSDSEKADALDAGWQLEPVSDAAVAVDGSAGDSASVKGGRKGGRKPKADKQAEAPEAEAPVVEGAEQV